MKTIPINKYLGKTINYLTIISDNGFVERNGSNYREVIAKCKCGNVIEVLLTKIKTSAVKSCGCFQKEQCRKANTKHGHVYHRMYKILTNMKDRCYNPQNKAYKFYGASGITICDQWHDYNTFYNWGIDNGYKDGLQIDRIDNTKGYFHENCRWVTRKVNCRNRRNSRFVTFKNETKTLAEWSEITGICSNTIDMRISKFNWPVEKALTIKPSYKHNKHFKHCI